MTAVARSDGRVLEVSDLSVMLGSHKALDAINFHLNQAETTAIVGPNGAGKSTLIKAILGLVPYLTGEILIDGKPSELADPSMIGYVPQLKKLDRTFPAVTCEMVASGLLRRWPTRLNQALHDQVVDALKLVGAAHLSHKPLKWLSGGEYQRVYIARALIRRPRLLLLDEPATGIDHLGEDDLYRYLEKYQAESKAAILVITHDWLAARHHTKCALLINRRQYQFGPAEEALTKDNLVKLFGHLHHDHLEEESLV